MVWFHGLVQRLFFAEGQYLQGRDRGLEKNLWTVLSSMPFLTRTKHDQVTCASIHTAGPQVWRYLQLSCPPVAACYPGKSAPTLGLRVSLQTGFNMQRFHLFHGEMNKQLNSQATPTVLQCQWRFEQHRGMAVEYETVPQPDISDSSEKHLRQYMSSCLCTSPQFLAKNCSGNPESRALWVRAKGGGILIHQCNESPEQPFTPSKAVRCGWQRVVEVD